MMLEREKGAETVGEGSRFRGQDFAERENGDFFF